MSLYDDAARVTSLVIEAKVESALAAAELALAEALAAPPSEQAALWAAIAGAEHVRGSATGMLTAAQRCISSARQSGNAGWLSCGLAMQARALARQGLMEPALLDLARSEAELSACEDPPLRCWAHTSLGFTYLELRLYELARPHLQAAMVIDRCPIPLVEAPVMQRLAMVELHLRWADELERSQPYPEAEDEVTGHRVAGHAYAEQAVTSARSLGADSLIAICHALELTSRPRTTAERSLPELFAMFQHEGPPDHTEGRAVVGTALARTLWAVGRRREALDVAREVVAVAQAGNDWQVIAGALWLLVELEAQSGVPGSAAGRSYAGLLSRVLWQQRLSTLQGAQAALEVEGLHRDHQLAQQAATEDALTGVSNRRVLDAAFRSLRSEASRARGSALPRDTSPMSLLLVDLNEFKVINDTYGHAVGDEVLQVVAMAMRGVARADDVVARIGGDEFVVLARNADEEAGAALAERLSDAIDCLGVGTSDGLIKLSASIGVATTRNPAEAAELMAEADAAMYAVKRGGQCRSA